MLSLYSVLIILAFDIETGSFASSQTINTPSFPRRAEDSGAWPRWCGKHYQSGSPADSEVVLAGQTPVPSSGNGPLLSFGCKPAMRPYVHDDTAISFILDASITHDVGQALPSDLAAVEGLSIKIYLESSSASPEILLDGLKLPLNTSGFEAQVNITKFPPSSRPYNVTCVANLNFQDGSSNYSTFTVTSDAQLYRLPENPYEGSVTKMDWRTGGMVRREEDSGLWRPFLPFGFYTYTDNLVANLSMIDAMSADGFNVIHLVPTFEANQNWDALASVLDRADAMGMLYIADFRDKYKTLSNIEQYVKLFRTRNNLLAWYTTDEPDGPGDDPTAASDAYDYLYQMDGYHPVSLVLNCADFRWNDYTAGADIVLSDVYPIAVNTTYSKKYHTACNATYGCCGCDDCSGSYADIGSRLDAWSERRRWLGRQRDLSFWTVPQAFDGTMEFWDRVPTGTEFTLQAALGLNHGAVGITPWANPYDNAGIARAAAEVAGVFTRQLAPIVLDPAARRVALATNATGVDAAGWIVNGSAGNATLLVLAANMRADSAPIASVDVSGLLGANIIQGVETLLGDAVTGYPHVGASPTLVMLLQPTGVAAYALALSVNGNDGAAPSPSGVSAGGAGLRPLGAVATVAVTIVAIWNA